MIVLFPINNVENLQIIVKGLLKVKYFKSINMNKGKEYVIVSSWDEPSQTGTNEVLEEGARIKDGILESEILTAFSEEVCNI